MHPFRVLWGTSPPDAPRANPPAAAAAFAKQGLLGRLLLRGRGRRHAGPAQHYVSLATDDDDDNDDRRQRLRESQRRGHDSARGRHRRTGRAPPRHPSPTPARPPLPATQTLPGKPSLRGRLWSKPSPPPPEPSARPPHRLRPRLTPPRTFRALVVQAEAQPRHGPEHGPDFAGPRRTGRGPPRKQTHRSQSLATAKRGLRPWKKPAAQPLGAGSTAEAGESPIGPRRLPVPRAEPEDRTLRIELWRDLTNAAHAILPPPAAPSPGPRRRGA